MWRRLSAALLFALAPAYLPAQRAEGSAEAEVERVARQYLDARLANDTATIRRLLADEYTGINSTGVLGDRASALRLPMNVTPMGQPIAGFDVDSVRVRVYGSTAVMTGIRRVRSADGSGGGGLRFTFVFIRRDGRWQLTASQATDLQPRGRPRQGPDRERSAILEARSLQPHEQRSGGGNPSRTFDGGRTSVSGSPPGVRSRIARRGGRRGGHEMERMVRPGGDDPRVVPAPSRARLPRAAAHRRAEPHPLVLRQSRS